MSEVVDNSGAAGRLDGPGRRRVRLINSTLRDGVQALWSGRITTDEIVPIALTLDLAGYDAVDFMAPVTFEVTLKHLRENPWRKARAVSRIIERIPLITHLRSRSLMSFDLAPDNVFDLWVSRLAASGFRRAMVFDALHDIRNLQASIRSAQKNGFEVTVVLFYTISPFHTIEYYASKAAQLAGLGADSICIRDPSGLLTPDRTRDLVRTIRSAVPNLPLELKSHCTTGQAEACYVEAALHGVDKLFVATDPLSGGVSVPSVRLVCEALAANGLDAGVDHGRIGDEEEYFRRLSEREGRAVAKASASVSQTQYAHQLPGNMLAFTRDQLRTMGLEQRFSEVLEEFPRVRADMGYPVMVTPISQLVCVQAVLNVVQGERYKTVPVEVRKYVHGAYGRPEAPLADTLLERAGPAPASDAEQCVDLLEQARKSFGPFASDDDLLLHVLFRPNQLVGIPMMAAADSAELRIGSRSLVDLIVAAAKQGGWRSVEVRSKGFSFVGRRFLSQSGDESQSQHREMQR